jgi:hypothetical protein
MRSLHGVKQAHSLQKKRSGASKGRGRAKNKSKSSANRTHREKSAYISLGSLDILVVCKGGLVDQQMRQQLRSGVGQLK